MSQPDYPVGTETQQLLQANAQLELKVQELTAAVNLLGANVQWIIDNVKGIFEMFSNPQFMSALPSMMAGGVPNAGAGGPGAAEPGAAEPVTGA